jgi:hypothetical protein
VKAIVRLIWSYFTCTPLLRMFTFGGAVALVGSCLIIWGLPQSGFSLALAAASAGALFIGSSMMPLMFGRMARSRGLGVLPGGRVKMLSSALATLMISAAPPAIVLYVALATALYIPTLGPAEYARFLHASMVNLWAVYTSTLLLYGWMYVAMWFITSQRNITGYLKGLIVVAAVILAPTREVVTLEVSLRWNIIELTVVWLVFGAVFLNWPRLQRRLLAWRVRFHQRGLRTRAAQVAGREIDLILGTQNPWLLAVGQFVPIALAARIGFYSAEVWLFYLTIFSTVAGAIAGQAAERSRGIWLRTGWSREQMFVHVERSFWRHNNYVLGILIVLMIAIGSYAGLSPALLAVGLPLLILGTTVSTYLGLMLTQGLRLPEATAAVALTLCLMAVAVLTARSRGHFATAIAFEIGLALVALALRRVARKRWSRLDWMLCRPDRALAARTPV